MKFRFLGDVDCPDWLLAEIYNLSQMNPTKIKSLGQVVINNIIEESLDDEKVKKLALDSKIEVNEIKALIAALEMIFTSSSRNSVLAADLSNELQQLGLPREHSIIISRLYTDHSPKIIDLLSGQSLRINRLESIEVVTSDTTSPLEQISLKIKTAGDKSEETTINIPKVKLNSFITELKTIRSLMEQVTQ